MPCNMCTQFEYDCYFEKHPRKRSKLVEQNAAQHGLYDDYVRAEPPKEDQSSVEDLLKMRNMVSTRYERVFAILRLLLCQASFKDSFRCQANLHVYPVNFIQSSQTFPKAPSRSADVLSVSFLGGKLWHCVHKISRPTSRSVFGSKVVHLWLESWIYYLCSPLSNVYNRSYQRGSDVLACTMSLSKCTSSIWLPRQRLDSSTNKFTLGAARSLQSP